ncbi:hypothetical protein COW36_07580 [bacterium (Candidatus Blackallbacteria) CG17_big_fil_post_rev_8_21_14_2_50_48_46]|uniref:Uncharacterized protein n=1 Tax=bacterium (Candidatus Blackallbacteria) CG17_big_fil_post_rev_8_21_14_2_50_48_46 TaxID=2014261 RepID=A0A2M7G6L8_9BACT|nr:MAG: hypothetical protein COW64_06285 [bacterium (Candidatus Blackallbacteria) CG18_big_fil_WC_8_21_14_2_50_49_26]PIW17700.1 MAG: hypothetical protein COW36_07580 [bacterium (Candidatus Blackallbacteria) CG17_big_fil_post_rev_8_21_14_2_50_48_46]PIW47516.1 MAG: hypothetical protein COW20_12325 [bacterium (Candidatus Blackallbacteria) CG13_big_fil_rev_8_21_14_2_50_49_14]
MLQAVNSPPLTLEPVRSPAARPLPAPTPQPLNPKPLSKDTLDLKSVGVGALAGAGTFYAPMVVGGYGMGAPFGATFKDSLVAPLVEKSTLALIGGAALAGGVAGSVAGRNTRNTGEALTTGAMVGASIGALSGAAVAYSTKIMSPMQGAMRGAMLGGVAGGAGGAGAYLLGAGK